MVSPSLLELEAACSTRHGYVQAEEMLVHVRSPARWSQAGGCSECQPPLHRVLVHRVLVSSLFRSREHLGAPCLGGEGHKQRTSEQETDSRSCLPPGTGQPCHLDEFLQPDSSHNCADIVGINYCNEYPAD